MKRPEYHSIRVRKKNPMPEHASVSGPEAEETTSVCQAHILQKSSPAGIVYSGFLTDLCDLKIL
jgi:hypothetical protein